MEQRIGCEPFYIITNIYPLFRNIGITIPLFFMASLFEHMTKMLIYKTEYITIELPQHIIIIIE